MILWRQKWENEQMSLIPYVMVNKKKHLSPMLQKHFCTVQQTENNSLFFWSALPLTSLPFWSSVLTERI